MRSHPVVLSILHLCRSLIRLFGFGLGLIRSVMELSERCGLRCLSAQRDAQETDPPLPLPRCLQTCLLISYTTNVRPVFCSLSSEGWMGRRLTPKPSYLDLYRKCVLNSDESRDAPCSHLTCPSTYFDRVARVVPQRVSWRVFLAVLGSEGRELTLAPVVFPQVCSHRLRQL